MAERKLVAQRIKVIMADIETENENSIILEVVFNVMVLFAQSPMAPKVLRDEMNELQRAIVSPFENIVDMTIAAKLHVLRFTVPAGEKEAATLKAVLRALLSAIYNVDQLSVRSLKCERGLLKLSAGMESGKVIMNHGEPFSEAAMLADVYATEAEKKGVTLIIGSRLFDTLAWRPLCGVELGKLETKGLSSAKPEVVLLTKLDLHAVAGAETG